VSKAGAHFCGENKVELIVILDLKIKINEIFFFNF
jgi:hypothetical protein